MVSYSKFVILFFLGIMSMSIFSNCKKDEPIITEPILRTFPRVDQELWSLFEAFEIEGAKRGFDIDLVTEGISGRIQSIEQEHVAGQCSYNEIFPGNIIVDAEFWRNSSNSFKEFIVFHELGHCYLHRDHREDVDEFGRCLSIMRSGLEPCRDNYTILTREEYLDELFQPEDF